MKGNRLRLEVLWGLFTRSADPLEERTIKVTN